MALSLMHRTINNALLRKEEGTSNVYGDVLPIQARNDNVRPVHHASSAQVTPNDHDVAFCTDKVIMAYELICAALDVALPRGANKHKVLRGTGIFEDAISPDIRINIKQYITLLENIQIQTKGNDISFLIGGALANTIAKRQIYAYADSDVELLNIDNVLSQLLNNVQFKWRLFPLIVFREFRIERRLLLVAETTVINTKLKQFVVEMAYATLYGLLKNTAGRRIPLAFTFRANRPRNIADFETHLGLNISFSMLTNSISLNTESLAMPLAIHQRDCPNKGSCIQGISDKAKSPILLTDYIRNAIYLNDTGQAVSADKLNISAATLKRKLKEFGTSFRILSEEVQFHQAVVLLSLAQLSNEQAAHAMHISDLPNFRRTVKRLTGKTPSELRAK